MYKDFNFIQIIFGAALAAFGGLITAWRDANRGGPMNWSNFFLTISTSALIGLLIALVATSYNFNIYLSGALSGMGGLCAPEVLELFKSIINAFGSKTIKKIDDTL